MTPLPLSKEEADALTKDLQAVLLKHGAELSVQSTLQMVRHVEPEQENTKNGKAGKS